MCVVEVGVDGEEIERIRTGIGIGIGIWVLHTYLLFLFLDFLCIRPFYILLPVYALRLYIACPCVV